MCPPAWGSLIAIWGLVMRNTITATAVGACILTLAQTAPAVAADEVLTARKCTVAIRNRISGGKRTCEQLTLRRDVPNGRLEILITFPDGFRLDVAGPFLEMDPLTTLVTPDRVVWANPGQTNPEVAANTPERPVVKGRCLIKDFHRTDMIGAVVCELGSPMGRIDIEFETPRPPK